MTDDYNIVREIGEGAYGKVKLVRHKKTGMERAAKLINRKHVKAEDEITLFEEVSILMRLDHPNIIRIYHVYQESRNFAIVTELCTGGELFERIQKSHSFSEKQAAELMKQILGAVNYLHENEIVHRDLKAENLLFENERPDSSLKLIDFGVSTKFKQGQNKKMKETLGTVSRAL
jgi:calcium-dependent protein kinase